MPPVAATSTKAAAAPVATATTPPPPRANAIVGETRPMDATANNAITVLRNITILRQRYIAPNPDRVSEVGMISENRYQLRRSVTQLSASHA